MSNDNQRVRIVDIANELGVSTATVSNVIHGKTKKISAETVKCVQEILEKKQYIPSMAGILLAQNNSRIIGMVVNDHEKYEGHTLEDNFISASINALALELDKAGYFLMLKLTKNVDEVVRFSSMWNMVGMILTGFCGQEYKKIREQMHIPLVVYDGVSCEEGSFANIEVDHYSGGVEAGKYLKANGHDRVLCISDNDISMDLMRFQGLKSIIPSAELMVIPYDTLKRNLFYKENLSKLTAYTAVFAVSDYYAIDLIQFLQANDIKVPDRISVIGFDDTREASHIHPLLTTIGQNHKMRACMALDLLRKQKEGLEFERKVNLTVSLIERESVKCISGY